MTTQSIAIHVRLDGQGALEASRLARWRGESLSRYVARLIERDLESQRWTLRALEALEGQSADESEATKHPRGKGRKGRAS